MIFMYSKVKTQKQNLPYWTILPKAIAIRHANKLSITIIMVYNFIYDVTDLWRFMHWYMTFCITIAFFTNTIQLFVTGWWAIGITVSWLKKIFKKI